MRSSISFVASVLLLAGCTNSYILEPIPGSITYGGQPRHHLTKSPIGSLVPHTFTDQWGVRTREWYILQPDRTLKLVDRVYLDSPFD
jgi:hypothetical protein